MKAEIKIIEYGNNIREDVRAGGKTIQLTLDTGHQVYRWERFFNYEDVTRSGWDRAYEYAIAQGKLVLGQMVIDDAFRGK